MPRETDREKLEKFLEAHKRLCRHHGLWIKPTSPFDCDVVEMDDEEELQELEWYNEVLMNRSGLL